FTATATDADLPVDTLTFSLDGASLAAGMTIDANTGAFSWTPTEGQGGSTPSVTITVTDSGTGNLIDSETFTITVNDVNSAPIIGGTDTGVVTEDRVDSTGKLSVAGALTIEDPDIGESNFVAQTIQGNFGNLTIDASGNWSYSADNSNAEIQALQAGESMTEILTVTTADGSTHDVEIIINGSAEAPPAPPPPQEPPPEEEPPADEPPDEVEEEQVGTGDDQILEEIVQVPQGIRSPDPEQDSGFAQANDSDSEPVDYPVIDKQPAKLPEQPQVQALKAQNLSIDTLTLQVSDDEALNEQYELELLERIDSMHLGMDLEVAQQNADDVDVKVFVGSTAGLTVGIVSWVLRGGALLASFMSTVPLLNRFDPLPILKAREDKEDVEPDDDDDEKTQIREHARKVDNMFSENGD
ncbi:MAG: VCBS domain-containing protein, partial [Gammaproteobacteria bacterium]|nr:VCBS domain-containing protein [Gammaproteobacteria bacterium]